MRKICGRRAQAVHALSNDSVTELKPAGRHHDGARRPGATVVKAFVRAAPHVASVAEIAADVLAHLGFGEIAWALRIVSWALRVVTSGFAVAAYRAMRRGALAMAAYVTCLARRGARGVTRFFHAARRDGRRHARRARVFMRRSRIALRRYRSRNRHD